MSLRRENSYSPKNISKYCGEGSHRDAIKSCIEADAPELLAEILQNDKDAAMYALLRCFTFIPATKCITYLISTGISLDDVAGDTTPRQYINEYFDTSSKMYSRARDKIMLAVEEGMAQKRVVVPEHVVIPINPPVEKKLRAREKIMTAFSLLKRLNTY